MNIPINDTSTKSQKLSNPRKQLKNKIIDLSITHSNSNNNTPVTSNLI